MKDLGPLNISLDNSPLPGQRYKNPMCFVQCCNYAMCFIQPINRPHSPWSQNVAPNTMEVYNVKNSQCISDIIAITTRKSATLHILYVFSATFNGEGEWGQ